MARGANTHLACADGVGTMNTNEILSKLIQEYEEINDFRLVDPDVVQAYALLCIARTLHKVHGV
jgi:hypothetical protein